ncbi:hypothetical protein OBK24_11385 [Empedobacter falsenii]
MKKFINKKISVFRFGNKEKVKVKNDFELIDLTNEEYTLVQYLIQDNEILIEDDLNKKNNFFSRISSVANDSIKTTSTSISNSLTFGKNKVIEAKNSTINFSIKSGEVIKDNSLKAYDNFSALDKKKLFFKVINNVDLLFLIGLLENLKSKNSNKNQLLAITGMIAILTFFNNNKSDIEAINHFKEDEEVNGVLKKISLKEILSYADVLVEFAPLQFRIPAKVFINILKKFV